MYNIFISFISQVTKRGIFISNFKYENPEAEIIELQEILKKNVSQF